MNLDSNIIIVVYNYFSRGWLTFFFSSFFYKHDNYKDMYKRKQLIENIAITISPIRFCYNKQKLIFSKESVEQ